MKIYTRSGDSGSTSLFAGGKVSKGALRIHAYGTIDELNAIIGLTLANGVPSELVDALTRVQNDLFSVGADLATPLQANPKWLVRTEEGLVKRLEREIDAWDEALPELRSFILPGGTRAAAGLHHARVVCRRAERWVVMLAESEELNPHALSYVNRLSDWLFVAARMANLAEDTQEIAWSAPKQNQLG